LPVDALVITNEAAWRSLTTRSHARRAGVDVALLAAAAGRCCEFAVTLPA
jgi:hypothetical protein